MSKSVKLKDGSYIDSEGVWDANSSKNLATALKYKEDYPDSITFTIGIGQDANYGMVGVTTSADRIHFCLPTYQGYSKISSSFTSGTAILSAAGKQNTCTITDVTDIVVSPLGYLHFKVLFTPALSANTVYAAIDHGTARITFTLSK